MPFADALSRCELCPRMCGADRRHGELGYCGAGSLPRVALVSLHRWEEPCISGKHGAGTVFFSHCSMKCVFCQNEKISSGGYGTDIDEARLADIFLEQQERGAATLDLVTPTHYAPQIFSALASAKSRGLYIPTVWNSSGYERKELVKEASGYVDVFMPDLKYVDDDSASRYSGAGDYFAFASEALREMVRTAGPPFLDTDGVMRRGVLVRHLVLPGRRRESMRALDWLWSEFGDDVLISLMNQYTPLFRTEAFPEIARKLTTFEYESVKEHALALGITRCYVQEKRAASADFVPDFDGGGVMP